VCGMVFTVTPFRLNKRALVVVTGKRVRSDLVVDLRENNVDCSDGPCESLKGALLGSRP
jgi:hypothetical protein